MAHKFKVGDRVVCVANTLKNKWDVDIIGCAGVVMDITDNPERYNVLFDREFMVRCMYPHELEYKGPRLKVEPPEETFEIGDIVRIVSDKWYGNKNLGAVGRVIGVNKDAAFTCYYLNIGDGCWFSEELKLVRKA